MVLDGLYMSLIGLAVVFMVLVFLLITINLINFFDKKVSVDISKKEFKAPMPKINDSMDNIVASIALSLALSESSPTTRSEKDSNFGSSNWLNNGQQRLFKSREV
ncbi:MAG: hypothetical protein CL769_03715 [Chloroflexi bacterium]|nr:hypothetical protein [Chloroflexota bacterium]|tara:strand:+ start:973 stop:1287 length:315 start_codon:yes stop_codon:yes gene_type:complete